MKQFQKIGVAAAVASVAAGAYATEVSRTETGDLAIVPYYTVLDGKNTGVAVINTTDSTQVVKVRLRRGADSKDALDFNIVLSPRDEWTANIGAGGSTGVQVTTSDTTCTVPEFPNGVAQMPDTYAEGATEGYIEIIGMAQTINETQPIAIGAKHKDGVPADCDAVRENFYRVAPAAAGTDISVRGVHTSALTSNGALSAGATGAVSANLSNFVDTDDNALKVSFFTTDSTGGLEFGDNAVMVSGFASAPMMTNQQPLSFGTDGELDYDPLNFELPNLAYGAYVSSVAARQTDGAAAGSVLTDGSMFDDLRAALDADAVANDWASFETANGSVNTDWVVTLPGQYAMTNPLCDVYDSYSQATTACSTANAAATANDDNELPLVLASNVANSITGANSRLQLWDREEKDLNGQDPVASPGLGFSPGGSAGDPAQTILLRREVNVLVFDEEGMGVLGSAESQAEDLGLKVAVSVEGGDRGWAELQIESTNATPSLWMPPALNDGDNIDPNANRGSFQAVGDASHTAVVGFAVWERSFADQAGNYGRAVEHSTLNSSSAGR